MELKDRIAISGARRSIVSPGHHAAAVSPNSISIGSTVFASFSDVQTDGYTAHPSFLVLFVRCGLKIGQRLTAEIHRCMPSFCGTRVGLQLCPTSARTFTGQESVTSLIVTDIALFRRAENYDAVMNGSFIFSLVGMCHHLREYCRLLDCVSFVEYFI